MRHAIGELRRETLGPVLTPEDTSRYAEEISPFNTGITHRPDVVVGAACEADVQRAVQFAGKHGFTIAVQSTGHGQFRPVVGGVLITTRRMTDLVVEPEARTATIGAGLRWREVVDATARHGLAPMSGSSSAVGAVGYLLGGGLGHLGRMYGFAADHIVRIRIVTPDGALRDVDAEQEPDLFWAVRGGKGNFGVVTEVEISLHPIKDVFAASVYVDGESTGEVLRAYAWRAEQFPPEFTSSFAILRLPDDEHLPAEIRGQTVGHLRFVSCGDSEQSDRAAAAALDAIISTGRVLLQEVGRRPYWDLDGVNADPVVPIPVWQRSGRLESLSDDAVTALLAAVGARSDGALALVELRHLGGALAQPASPPNAVAGRGDGFSLLLLGVADEKSSEIVASQGAAALERMRPFLNGRALFNWLGLAAEPHAVARAFDPQTLERLLDVKAAVDPDNLMSQGHSLAGRVPAFHVARGEDDLGV